MTLFKTFTLKWWQAGLYKLGMLALGVSIGAYCHAFVAGHLLPLLVLAALSLAYITYVWWRQ